MDSTSVTGWRSGSKEEVLKVIRDFPEGIGIPFIRETLRIPDTTVREYAEELVREGLIRKEEKLVFRRPYYWFVTYYPIVVPILPPPPVPPPPIPTVNYVHKTLVYNVKTGGKDSAIDISITFDFDVKDEPEIKDTFARYCMLKAQIWLESKFENIPIKNVWAEEKERPSDLEVADRLREENLDFTALHYKWNYYRQFGNKTEESENDFEDWEIEIPTGATWGGVRKGRLKEVKK